ncbi:putative POM121-like protein 1 [Aotus nancymaae]|uniref:putative POM121-like protein 1 n=1 Tax=Aotus nancymaae TaxID=37293 RepID=UPI0030FEAF72
MSCSSASALSMRTLSEALEQVVTVLGPTTPSCAPHSYPENLIMSRALKVSGAGMPEQGKDPRAQEKPDDQKGGPEGTRDARSAFRPLRDNGGLSPFVPRPGPLQRDLHTQRSEIPSDKISQPSGMSCCPKRNSISSSYSSTGGFPWLKRRKGPASSHCQLPLTSSKTVSEVSPPAVSRGQTQCEKVADSAPGEKPAPRSGSQTSQASRPPRRKFPLLPRRQGEPLMLSPPLQLGFRVTAEDLDLEKKVALLCIDSALRGEAKSIRDCRASLLSHALSSPATGASSLPSVPKAPSRDAQRERCKSQGRRDPVALLPSAAGSPSRPPVSGRKRRSADPLVSSSDPLPATSAHSRDSAQVTSLIPARFPAASSTLKRARPSSDLAASAAAQGPSTASGKDTTTLAGQRVSGPSPGLKLPITAAATTQPKPVVLHGQQQGTRGLKRARSSSDLAASAAAQASSSAPRQPAQGPSTASGKGTTTLAGQRVSGPSPGLKLPITAAATTQPKPVVLHGQQQGTRGLKRARSSSDLAASAAAQASSSAPRQPAQGPSTASGKGTTTLAGQRVSGPSPGLKLPITAAATTQPKPVVLHGQQQGTRGLKRARPSSDLAASAAAQASSSAPRQPAQGPTAHSAAGVSLPTTSTSSPPAKRKSARAAGPAGTLAGPTSTSPRDAHAPFSRCGLAKARRLH